ncbi:MAG: hypothetical protein QM831_32185 [Kofleriaceae bacterium]
MTDGISGILVETYNYGKTVAFWKALGYEIEFETDHSSGQLQHPKGGPFVFVAERAPGTPLNVQLAFGVPSPSAFVPPKSGTVVRGWEPQHWDVTEMIIADPDNRQFAFHAPKGAK